MSRSINAVSYTHLDVYKRQISDRHLIRKLARHYPHEIEVAIITRVVNTITEFEQVLLEFNHLRNGSRSMNQRPNDGRFERNYCKNNGEERGKVSERDGFTEERTHYIKPTKWKSQFWGETNGVPSTSNAGSKVEPTKHKNYEV